MTRSVLGSTFVAALMLAAVACSKTTNGPEVGSETNWIACHSNDECRGGAQCECGVCTKRCGSSKECSAIGDGTTCLETTAMSAGGCRVGFAGPAAQGICVPGCERSADCGDALQCVSGVCVPREAITPAGKVEDLPVTNGQAMIPAQPLATGGAGSGSSSGSGSGSVAGSGSVDDGLLTHGITDESGYEYPNPKPQCPCTSDFGVDEVAPRVGEVDSNPYGGAIPPLPPTPLASAQTAPLECALGGIIGPLRPIQFEIDSKCTLFVNCPLLCKTDADCPSGGSGTATARCAGTEMCFLDCREGRTCPDGMACVSGSDGAACYWPRDVLHPDCPGYCAQRPPPRECANWCAERLVACDEAHDVRCCAGLVCTDEGFCDAP